ncbi:MAG: GAF domain-containing protein [Anaerolineae bacterium]
MLAGRVNRSPRAGISAPAGADEFAGVGYAPLVVLLALLVGLPYSYALGGWPQLALYAGLCLAGSLVNLAFSLAYRRWPHPRLFSWWMLGVNLLLLTLAAAFLGGVENHTAPLLFAVHVLVLGILWGWQGAWRGLTGGLLGLGLLTVTAGVPFPSPLHIWALLHGSILLAVAGAAGSAGQQARNRYREEVRRREIAEALREIAAALVSAWPRDRLLSLVLEQLARVVPYDTASVLLLEGDVFRVVAVRGFPPEDREAVLQLRFPAAPGTVNYRVLQSNRYLLIPDVREDPGWAVHPATAKIRSWIGVPLRAKGRTLGLLGIDGHWPGQFTEVDAQTALALADQAALALENAQLYADLLRQLREMTTLMEVARVLSSTLAQEDLLEAIRQQVAQIMRCSSYFLALYHKETEELDFKILVDGGQRYPPVRAPLGRGPASVVVRERQPLLVHDLPQEAEALGLEPQRMGSGNVSRSWLGVPLETRGRLLGLMAVTDYEPHVYTEADAALLENIARQVALALENSRLYEEARLRNEELERANRELLATRDRLVRAERAAALAQLGTALQHEINNPLTVVLGQVSLLLKREDLAPEARSALEAALDHALRIRDIMRKLQSVEDRLTTYIRGVEMIDLGGSDEGDGASPSAPSGGPSK